MKKNRFIILTVLSGLIFLSGSSLALASEITGGLSNQGVIPIAPSGVTATTTDTFQITISWNAVAGVDGYRIYRKKGAEDFGLLADNITSLSYVNGSLTDGIYSYQVQSFKGTLSTDLDGILPTMPITIVTPEPETETPAPSGGGGGGGGGGVVTTPATTTNDFNGDNKVDVFDFNILIANWGATGATQEMGDADGNGIVGILDFNLLIINWQA